MYKSNKRKIITAFLICASAVSITACNKDDKSSSTSVVTDADIVSGSNSSGYSENDVTSIPEIDDDGNKITVIAVTDEAGKIVTDNKGDAVTQLAIVDNSNNIITNAEGIAVKPNIKTITKASETINNDNTVIKDEDSKAETGTNANGTEANYKYGSLLWMAKYSEHAVTNAEGNPTTNADGGRSELVFNGIQEGGEVFAVTFKVNENAAPGNYDIILAKETETRTSSLCNNKGVDVAANYYSGVIAVGTDKAPEASGEHDGLSLSLSNACAKPGDIVTLYGTISNNTMGIAAFNTYIKYDSNSFTLQKITAGSLIDGNGDFITS